MDESLRRKLAAEMTHQYPVQSERPIADMWGGMNNLQRLGLFQIPVVSDAAGLLGDVQMYREQPETRGLLNYGMSAMGMLPFVPGAFGAIKKLDDYAIPHRPMTVDSGAAPLHDLLQAFGPEIYQDTNTAMRIYGGGLPEERRALRVMQKFRGQPDAMVTIYRGVPAGVDAEINAGDWVTLTKEIAKLYGDKILEKQVKAKDVTSWADSLAEFGYFPEQ